MKINEVKRSLNLKSKALLSVFSALLMVFALNCANAGGGETSNGGGGGCTVQKGLAGSTASSTSHKAGEACLSCHNGVGGNPVLFSVGGTVYTSTTGTVDTSRAGTVITLGSGGAADQVTIDSCGNFFKKASVTFFAGGTGITIGTGTAALNMGGGFSGDCNKSGCHGPTDNRRIF